MKRAPTGDPWHVYAANLLVALGWLIVLPFVVLICMAAAYWHDWRNAK